MSEYECFYPIKFPPTPKYVNKKKYFMVFCSSTQFFNRICFFLRLKKKLWKENTKQKELLYFATTHTQLSPISQNFWQN